VKRRCFVHGVRLSELVLNPAMIELILHLLFDSGFGFVDLFSQFIRNV